MMDASASPEVPTRRARYTALLSYAALLATVCVPNFAFLAWGNNGVRASDATMACALGVGFVLSTALLCNQRPAWLALALAPFAALAPAECAYIRATGLPSDADTLSLLRESNAMELGDLAGGFGTVGLLAGVALLLALFAVVCLHRSRIRWRHWSAVALPLAFAASTGFAAFIDQRSVNEEGARDPFAGELPVATGHALRDNYPAGLVLRASDYFAQRAQLMRAVQLKAGFRFGAQRLAHAMDTAPALVVLVIGESSRADHWSLNGYHRLTNPRLSKRAGLVSFRNFHAPWTLSREAVPVIVTRKPPDSPGFSFGEASIVALFNEAGFRTDWISVQPEVGYHDSPISIYAYEASRTHFLNPVGFAGNGAHDDVILPATETVLKAGGSGPAFIVVHLLGSHYNYVHRYPPAFDVFHPTLRGIRKPSLFDHSQRERMVNSYDNSIIFTDHVLDGLMARLEATGRRSLLFYVSDHGEDLFEDCSGRSGHGNDTLFGHWVSALVWVSPQLQAAQPGLLGKFERFRDTPLSTSVVFDTLVDAAGIGYPSARPAKDMLSGAFETPPELSRIPGANGSDVCAATAATELGGMPSATATSKGAAASARTTR